MRRHQNELLGESPHARCFAEAPQCKHCKYGTIELLTMCSFFVYGEVVSCVALYEAGLCLSASSPEHSRGGWVFSFVVLCFSL